MYPPGNSRDLEYLDRLRDYHADAQRIPSLQRICELVGFSSRTAAKKLLERLAAAGFVTRTPEGDAWMPTERFFMRPLVDASVRAGGPEDVVAAATEPFLIDQYLVSRPSATVMIPVRGDSMTGAGIYEGDLVVVDRVRKARAGDLVIAVVDGEFTLKELSYEGRQPILRAHNPAYPPIHPQRQLEIHGVVTGLVRRYVD